MNALERLREALNITNGVGILQGPALDILDELESYFKPQLIEDPNGKWDQAPWNGKWVLGWNKGWTTWVALKYLQGNHHYFVDHRTLRHAEPSHFCIMPSLPVLKEVRWDDYLLKMERVPTDEGGTGEYRLFYPTFGYAVVGTGYNVKELYQSLEESKEGYMNMLSVIPHLEIPQPTDQDKNI